MRFCVLNEVKKIMKLYQIKKDLIAKGIDEYEVREILLNVLNVDNLDSQQELTASQVRDILKAGKKHLKGMPVNKIFGVAYFYGMKLNINNHVLAPRSDTEVLVERVLQDINPQDKVLDLCTGSGAIALALAKYGNANVSAVDISRLALRVAKSNAQSLGLNVDILRSDMFSKVSGKYDIITCNPPYISATEYKTLDKSVRKYDPKLALVGKDNGMQFYKRLANECKDYLVDGGRLYMEIGYNQAQDVKDIFTREEYTDIEIIQDLGGRDRVIKVTKKEQL